MRITYNAEYRRSYLCDLSIALTVNIAICYCVLQESSTPATPQREGSEAEQLGGVVQGNNSDSMEESGDSAPPPVPRKQKRLGNQVIPNTMWFVAFTNGVLFCTQLSVQLQSAPPSDDTTA